MPREAERPQFLENIVHSYRKICFKKKKKSSSKKRKKNKMCLFTEFMSKDVPGY